MAKQKAGTAVATTKANQLDELNKLVMETATLEAANRDVGGVDNKNYINIIGNFAPDDRTDDSSDKYIKGAVEKSWVIDKLKLHLGKSVELTVLGSFSVYEDSVLDESHVPKKGERQKRKVVGYWHPEDAEQIPLEGYFDRPFIGPKDGKEHILRPHNWVYVYLHDHPDVPDAVVTFKSTGNKVYRELQKLIAGAASTGTELVLTMTSQKIQTGDWGAYLYPAFEVTGRNYDIKDGKITLIKGGMDINQLSLLLNLAHGLQNDYANGVLVRRQQGFRNANSQTKQVEYKEDEEDKKEKRAAKF